MFAKFINYSLNKIGYEINKVKKNYSFDHIYTKFLKQNCSIVDVGANEGQSVKRFLSLFPNSKIYCFEPVKKAYDKLKTNYSKKNIYINNLALGARFEKKFINIYKRTSNSSFNKPIKNSYWEKKKKMQFNSNNLIDQRAKIQVITLDSYLKKNNLHLVDLLKIDTQQFEDQILNGAQNSLKRNIIRFIEIEFIMGNQYRNRLNIINIEKYLIKNNFRLLGISQSGDIIKKPDLCIDLLYGNINFIKIR
jgi:FkbM family methyltransferase